MHVVRLLFARSKPRSAGEKSNGRHLGNQLAQERDALGRKLEGAEVDPGQVAARSVETGHEAIFHGINANCENDRNRRSGRLYCEYGTEGARYHDDLRLIVD